MFSGQGSHYFQMGKVLYEQHPRFALWMDHCDDIAAEFLPLSLLDIIYQPDKLRTDPFDRALYTNPAILCIEYCLARVVMEMGIKPDYLLGYSLGEFSAAVVGGAIPLKDGIELVIEFARLLEDDMPHAGMLAVIDNIAVTRRHPQLLKDSWITGRNFDKNFVVSGLSGDLDKLERELAERNILFQRLAVNHGFHTALLDPIESQFKQLVSNAFIGELTIPTISALTGKVIVTVDEHHLWQVVRQPVAFDQTILNMLKQGDYRFIDIGPSGSLATFVKYILPKPTASEHHEVINPFGKNIQSLDKLKASFGVEIMTA
jgi:bacillaene synthase trans-acting acyltransferase